MIRAQDYIYRAKWLRERNPDCGESLGESFHGSPQYVKAMRASFPAEKWPAKEERFEFTPERKVYLVLRDGSEIDSGGHAFDWQAAERQVSK